MNGSARLGVLGGSSGNPLLARSAARSAGIMGPLHREPVFPLLPDSSRYHHPKDHGITEVAKQPVSTFALDVDTGSYSNVRSYLRSGLLPPKDAVRLEEFVNYFPYEYPPPVSPHPFGVVTEVARCPWNPAHSLLRIGVRAADITPAALPSANLVFLIDVSGSMQSEERLPLLQQSLRFLVEQLRPQDQISIVVYAGSEAVLLPPTSAAHKQRILSVIDSLQAGGSTAGHSGIRAAYELARQSFIPSGTNRILLATDGDFNVGVSDTEELVALVERERKSGVSLSTLGFGFGNVNDHMMERLADAGNGSYSFIDSLREGRKVLLTQAYSTLHTVAKDVKIQIEFNPAQIREYRLLGYENRILNREDFQNDHVDAGEIGAGATATALYELTPIEAKPSFEPLRYAMATAHAAAPGSSKELGFIRVRYKSPKGESSKLLELPVAPDVPVRPFLSASYDLRFAASVAGFAQLLRNSPNLGSFSWDDVLRIARNAKGQDEHGYRHEFLWMVQTAASLNTRSHHEDP